MLIRIRKDAEAGMEPVHYSHEETKNDSGRSKLFSSLNRPEFFLLQLYSIDRRAAVRRAAVRSAECPGRLAAACRA